MNFKPCGDAAILERFIEPSDIILPDNRALSTTDLYIVKAVGVGYVTEQGVIIKPEIQIGDKVVVMGKIVPIATKNGEILMARCQDIIAYERPEIINTQIGDREEKIVVESPTTGRII